MNSCCPKTFWGNTKIINDPSRFDLLSGGTIGFAVILFLEVIGIATWVRNSDETRKKLPTVRKGEGFGENPVICVIATDIHIDINKT